MAALRTQLEDAVIAALAPLKLPSLGGGAAGYLKCVEPYGGELEALEDLEDVERALAGRAPGILVTTGPGTYRGIQVQRRRYTRDVKLNLIIVSANMRSHADRNRGETTNVSAGVRDPGIYQIIEDILSRLIGWIPAVDGAGPLKPENEDLFAQTPAITVWRFTFEAQVDAFAPPVTDPAVTEIVAKHSLERPRMDLATGAGDALAKAGATMTLTDVGAMFVAAYAGLEVVIEGAASPANNGTFAIAAVVDGTHIQYTNANGVAEPFAGTWRVRLPAHVTTNAT